MALIKSTEMMHVWRRIALLAAAVCMAMVSTMPSSMAATAASPVASKYLVDVRVFFRAFCPACQWFVGDPLLELIRQEEFRNIVNLNVYPAAGMMEKNGVFDCEGGELECEGHQWEVCIIEKDKDDVVKYLGGLACIEGDESGEIGEWETKLQNCFTAAERATLKECYDKRSADILRKMMKAERFDAVEWMPYTLVSGKVLGSASTGVGLSDLQTNVCLSYKGPKKYYPDMCQQLVGAQKQVAPDDEPVVATTAPAAVAANADKGATPKPAAQAEKKDDIAAGNEPAEAEADGDEMDLPMKGDEDVKVGDANKIRLDLYWRAFCPGCRGFITKPLRKLLGNPEFRKIVDFHPVPAAGTQMDKDGNFMCTKGVVECQGHRWLSCAVNEFPKVEELIVHLACLEDPSHKGSKWSAVVGKCFSTEDAKKMRTCYEDKSRSLLAKFIDEREKIEVQWVPYVLLDSVVIGDARHGIGYKQLQEEVCRAYKGPEDARPTACQPKRLRQDEEKEDAAKATEKVIKPCPPKKETAKPAEVDKDAPGAGFRRPLKQSDPIADAQREVADREAAEVARGLENAAKANAAAAGGDASTGFSFSSLLFPLGCFAVVGLVARRLSGDHKKDA